ncbi:hypothetical protein [Flavobacterium sp.]|nr:hypothetical protein [Flavobacterium sp.]
MKEIKDDFSSFLLAKNDNKKKINDIVLNINKKCTFAPNLQT